MKENSSEEDIKRIEKYKKAVNKVKSIITEPTLIEAIDTILLDYKKLQKGNEKLNIKLDDKETEIQILKDDIKADEVEYKSAIETLKKENEEY